MATSTKTRKSSTGNKITKKLGRGKKSVSSTSSKNGGRKKSPGIFSKAKKVVGEVLTGAVAGAATGAVVGAAEAGSKATGIGQSTKSASKEKRKSATPGTQ